MMNTILRYHTLPGLVQGGSLRLYVEVSRILGPRALDGMRTDAASQLAFAAANTAAINGGQLRAGSARVRVTRVN